MNECWLSLDEYSERPAAALSPWLTDPGWLTPRLRAAAGRSGGFHLVGQKALPLDAALREKLDVDDETRCCVRLSSGVETRDGCMRGRYIRVRRLSAFRVWRSSGSVRWEKSLRV